MASGRFPGLGVQRFTPQRLSAAFPPAWQWHNRDRLPHHSGGTAPASHRLPFFALYGHLRQSLGLLVSEGRYLVKRNGCEPGRQGSVQTSDYYQSAGAHNSPGSACTDSLRVEAYRPRACGPDRASRSGHKECLALIPSSEIRDRALAWMGIFHWLTPHRPLNTPVHSDAIACGPQSDTHQP